jgi:hypothetical protein
MTLSDTGVTAARPDENRTGRGHWPLILANATARALAVARGSR